MRIARIRILALVSLFTTSFGVSNQVYEHLDDSSNWNGQHGDRERGLSVDPDHDRMMPMIAITTAPLIAPAPSPARVLAENLLSPTE